MVYSIVCVLISYTCSVTRHWQTSRSNYNYLYECVGGEGQDWIAITAWMYVACSNGVDRSPIQISARRYRANRLLSRLHATAGHGHLPPRRVPLPTGRTDS